MYYILSHRTTNYVYYVYYSFSILDLEMTEAIEGNGTEKEGKIEMREIEGKNEDRTIETV